MLIKGFTVFHDPHEYFIIHPTLRSHKILINGPFVLPLSHCSL